MGIRLTSPVALLTAFATLAGCATTSEIAPYGRESFILSAGDIWGGYSGGSLQVRAAQTANEFCQKQGKVFVVRNTSVSGVQGWSSTSSTLIFSCVSESDPEFSRPNLRREADTVIEDRRR
jgi:hypothetical protein